MGGSHQSGMGHLVLLRVWTAQEDQGGGREAKATALFGAEDRSSSQGRTVG